jgi:hypothetical protein
MTDVLQKLVKAQTKPTRLVGIKRHAENRKQSVHQLHAGREKLLIKDQSINSRPMADFCQEVSQAIRCEIEDKQRHV